MDRTRYRVDVSREGRWWVAYVPDVDYRTQARTLAEVDEMARSLVAGALSVEEDGFDLDVRVTQPDDVCTLLTEASHLDQEAQRAVSAAAQDRRAAARALREVHGLSVIDTARVLGVTRARVYQLLDAS